MIELRVVELGAYARTEEIDITCLYNAQFFLHATLETPQEQGTKVLSPLLMGSCVSSVAYLNTPSPAGYFVFPDLAVPTEGQYCLKFSLFELVKGVGFSDMDSSISNPFHAPYTKIGRIRCAENFRFRLEVKSIPFTVFKPRDFPGLLASTSISHCLAEQGCPIRLRGPRMKVHGNESEGQSYKI